ncbi:transposase-like protein [Alkalibacillus filiformis]|uniref:Transposase-like protein n=1 Tax=Alkalibacillus filiformis TaxID=200990 RepID=A0ABU0DXJ3_9BACI|nr:transposase [Alkalibacillus filiformis]MDQ0353090.1 transposase-like protein [Alkalibacillus filiformis]
MGKRKIEIFEDLKKKYVRMALETNQYASTAKSAGVSSSTLRNWMRQYETEVLDQMESEGVRLTQPEPTEKEYKKKYEQAMKLLGEKELEVAVLKDALKKNDHH